MHVTSYRASEKLKVLDLFAGIGGFSLGLERTGGFETIGFVEIDKKAQKVLRKHWPLVPLYDDIKELDGKAFYGSVDVITGGFPCQDISVAGKGAGLEGQRSGLWYEYHRIIKETQPAWVIIENVSALRSRGLDKVLGSLAEIGYDAEWHCIPASAVGAPHRRDRIWIVAYPAILQRNGGNHHPRERMGQEAFSEPRDGRGAADVAYPSRELPYGSGPSAEQAGRGEPSNSCEDVADTNVQRLEGWLRQGLQECSSELSVGEGGPRGIGSLWAIEPNVGQVADGVPQRVDRLKQLGNAVVPQIPQLIGTAILRHIGMHTTTMDTVRDVW